MSLILRNKSVLYIDPNTSYASMLSNVLFPDVKTKALTNNSLDQSRGYFDAIRRIKSRNPSETSPADAGAAKPQGATDKNYDIILCEYELGDNRTAQELLEEIRRKRLVPLSCIFIMISSEQQRDRVMSVLEFAPDAYILKSENTPDMVERRIAEAIADREELLPIFIAIDRKNHEEALRLCNDYIEKKGRLSRKVKRLRGLIYLELRDYENAKRAYEELLKIDSGPDAKNSSSQAYAKNGLARSLYHLGKPAEAEQMLREITEESPDFMQGYDSLSELLLGTGRAAEAQEVMQQAVDRSPKRYDRQQLLALTALENEDFTTSRDALKKVTREGRFLASNHPSNYALLAESQLELGNFDDAMKALREAGEFFKKTEHAKTAEFCSASMEHAIHTRKGDTKRAAEALQKAVDIHQSGGSDFSSVNERLQANFAVQCFAGGHAEVAEGALEVALQGSAKGAETVRKVAAKKLAARPDVLQTVIANTEKAERALTQTLDNVLTLFKGGSLDEALTTIETMVRDSPNNPEILAKAAQISLMYIEHTGFDKRRFDYADSLIAQIQRMAPDSKHARVLHLLSDRVRKKYTQDEIPQMPVKEAPQAAASGGVDGFPDDVLNSISI
jgi:tetratricopeptide (TPR) repeat protein